MADDRVYLFDTTLRDGQQTRGVDFTVADKVAIARALDALGVDYIEGGWPGANPTDNRFFAEPPALDQARLVAFGMTRRPGRSVENDPGLSSILDARVPAVCLVGKTWDFHVDVALEIEREENIAMVRDSIARAKAVGREAMFDCEHFFDGYKANPDYAQACAVAAYEAGARWVVLCDTNGGTLPDEIEAIVGAVAERVPGSHLGIHTHDDTGNAVANSLAGVRAGARQVQGTINGLGERCGNADLMAVIPSLVLKMGLDCGVTPEKLTHLTAVSRMLDERLNRPSDPHRAYVGAAAFEHKGGLHVSAVQKNPKTYEHVEPASVGNERHILVSDQAGRSNILARFAEIGVEIDANHPKVQRLVDEVKDKEYRGYSFDSAEASFELLARRQIEVGFHLGCEMGVMLEAQALRNHLEGKPFRDKTAGQKHPVTAEKLFRAQPGGSLHGVFQLPVGEAQGLRHPRDRELFRLGEFEQILPVWTHEALPFAGNREAWGVLSHLVVQLN